MLPLIDLASTLLACRQANRDLRLCRDAAHAREIALRSHLSFVVLSSRNHLVVMLLVAVVGLLLLPALMVLYAALPLFILSLIQGENLKLSRWHFAHRMHMGSGELFDDTTEGRRLAGARLAALQFMRRRSAYGALACVGLIIIGIAFLLDENFGVALNMVAAAPVVLFLSGALACWEYEALVASKVLE